MNSIGSGGPSPPARFGRYIVDPEPVGVGGFGVVFRAHDPRIPEQPVAIKVLKSPAELGGISEDEWLAARTAVETEARLLRSVQDQHLITIYDIGHHDDPSHGEVPYFVMEYAERGTLRQRLDLLDRRLTNDEVNALIGGVAAPIRSLSHSRRGYPNGIVHRDVKDTNYLIRIKPGARDRPAGELLAADEELVLADLGLARPIDADAGLTSGAKGTVRWCAPEQLEHDAAVDIRADIFAASALITAALTNSTPIHRLLPGQPLFDDATLAGTGPFEAELRKGMAPERADRHQTIDEWESALRSRASQPGSIAGRMPGRPERDTHAGGGGAAPDVDAKGLANSASLIPRRADLPTAVPGNEVAEPGSAGVPARALSKSTALRSVATLLVLAAGLSLAALVISSVRPGDRLGVDAELPDQSDVPAAAGPTSTTGSDISGRTTELELGVEVVGSLTSSEVHRYRFRAEPGQSLYFDAWPGGRGCDEFGDPGMSWRLPKQAEAPDDGWFFNAYLSSPEGECRTEDFGPVTFDEGGWFDLNVFYLGECGDCAGRYAFAAWEVPAPDRFAIEAGVQVSAETFGPGAGELESPGAVDIYELEVEAGAELLIEHLPDGGCWEADPGLWLVVPTVAGTGTDTYWDAAITSSGSCDPYDVGPITIEQSGTLRLEYSYKSDNAGTGSYSFTVATAPSN